MWRLLARLGDRHAAAVFLTPPLLLVIVMALFPLVMSLGLSFVHWNLSNPAAGVRFAGVDHWARLFEDSHFHRVALNTILYVVFGVPIQYGLGLLLAVVLNSEIRARNFFRVLFLLPMMLSPIAISFVVGRVMFNEAAGPVNDLLISVGLEPVPWLSDNALAFATVLIVDIWQWTPFMMLILLAGLQSVSEEVVEAGPHRYTVRLAGILARYFPVAAALDCHRAAHPQRRDAEDRRCDRCADQWRARYRNGIADNLCLPRRHSELRHGLCLGIGVHAADRHRDCRHAVSGRDAPPCCADHGVKT